MAVEAQCITIGPVEWLRALQILRRAPENSLNGPLANLQKGDRGCKKGTVPNLQLLAEGFLAVGDCVVPAHGLAVEQGEDLAACRVEAVGQKHRLRMPLVDLERVDVVAVLAREQVEHELRGLLDVGDGVGRVPAAQKRKVRDRVEFVQKRAGRVEEIARVRIGVPCNLQGARGPSAAMMSCTASVNASKPCSGSSS